MKHIDCEKAKLLFDESIDGVINTKQSELLSAHLKTCENCLREYQARKAVSQYMREIAPEIPEQLHRNIISSIKKQPQVRSKTRKGIRILAGAAVAAVVCIAVLHSPSIQDFEVGKSMEKEDIADGYDFPSINHTPEFPSEDTESPAIQTDTAYSKDLPKEDELVVNIQKNYSIEGTPYILWVTDHNKALIFLSEGDKDNIIMSVNYTETENTVRIEADGEKQDFDKKDTLLVPTDGTLLEKLILYKN